MFVPHGSGDVYIGTQRTRNKDGLFFAGHNTLEAVVSDLRNRSGFGAARRVLLSGRSAGGIGVFQNADWLGAQLERLVETEVAPLVRDESDRLPLRGAMLPLRWETGRFTALQLDGDTAVFQTTSRAGETALHRALRDFYEAQARADIGRWMPRYLPALPRAPRRVQLKIMSSQWGSLAPDGTMALDLSLVLAPQDAFEYVLVHELCHLIHHDHSPAYWHEVERRFPRWRDQRDWFREHGRQLKAQMVALVR